MENRSSHEQGQNAAPADMDDFMHKYLDRDQKFREDDLAHRKDYLNHNKADLKERKRRTWLIFSGILLGPLLSYLMMYYVFGEKSITGDYVAMVRIEGEIASDKNASAETLVPAIKEAFEDKKAKGVVLVINSPGGTPVQASIIHDAVMKYRKLHPEKKVMAVGEDMVTSGAYWIATAAPEIYVNRSTLAGSIGVIMSGFGVDVEQYRKYGVERRVWTAGAHKDRMDPFRPVESEDKAKVMSIVNRMHTHFIQSVKETRKDKIKGSDDVIYSGDFWTGDEAVEMGLADGFGDLNSLLAEKFKVEKVANYTPQRSIFDNMKKSFRSEMTGMVAEALGLTSTGYALH